MAITAAAARRLREIYLDQQVVVYLRDMNVVTVNEEHGEMKISAMAEGYVIDIDTNFVYLGLPDGTITRTINHDLAQMIEIAFGGELLDMDFATSDEDIH